MNKFNMISGLPRSGSTLLCNILNMNPKFHATPTSPTIDLLNSARNSFSHNASFKASDRMSIYENLRQSMLGALEGRYHDKDVVFDKNRMWPSYISLIDHLLKNNDSKIIWTFRHPNQVIRSMERKNRETPLFAYPDESNGVNMSTIENRVNYWINNIVWSPLLALQDAVDMGYTREQTPKGQEVKNDHQDRILIVMYSELVTEPQRVMNKIHDFLGEERFAYNKKSWKDLKQTTTEYDTFYNYKYPHKIHEGFIEDVKKELKPDIPDRLQGVIKQKFGKFVDYIYDCYNLEHQMFMKNESIK